MATEVKLPALGESVTEGTVTQWLKSVGDEVAVDEALLEVSTDKVDTEIPSPVAGTLLEIRADEDETVEVGAVLAVIGESGESSAGRPTIVAGDSVRRRSPARTRVRRIERRRARVGAGGRRGRVGRQRADESKSESESERRMTRLQRPTESGRFS